MSDTLLGEWYQHDLHTQMQNILVEQSQYQLFQMLKPELKQDGNQWCVLYGDNLQVGITGFGDTPYEAIRNWNQAWHSKITNQLQ